MTRKCGEAIIRLFGAATNLTFHSLFHLSPNSPTLQPISTYFFKS